MGKTRAVAYIRVSTGKDAQLHSYDFQEQYWRSVFEKDPTTELVNIYADKGISGHSIQKRPQFLAMMEDARSHRFDKIYTKSVSRFARNTTQLLDTVRELREIGVEVVFEKENVHSFDPTSEIFLTLAATIAENDLEVDSERMRWSVRHRFENGWISVGNGLFGYKMTGENDLVIVPEEAKIVRFVFDAYVNRGLGSRVIANALNEAGIVTRKGNPWRAKCIVNMIQNEKYKGDSIMGKNVKRLGKYYSNKEADYAPRFYTADTHEAIIDKETWEKAQQIMSERGSTHSKTTVSHPFSGMIECGCCGKQFIHKVNSSGCKWQTGIWACATYLRDGKKACANSRIKDSVLKEEFVSAYNEFIEKRPQGDLLKELQEKQEDLRQQEKELADLMLQRLISREVYKQELAKKKRQIAEVSEKALQLRTKSVPEEEHCKITEFSEEKARRFLTKVIVTQFTVTFVFYNGAKVNRPYSNGQPGNKPGWNREKEEA